MRIAFFLLMLLQFLNEGFAQEELQPIADCHCHLLDFLQNGDVLEDGKLKRPKPGDALKVGDRHRRMEMIIHSMDKASVSHALISGMPFLKRWNANSPWRPSYYLDSTSRLVLARDSDYVIANAITDWKQQDPKTYKKQIERLYPSICAIEITDLNSVDRIVKLGREFPGLWKAVGEIFSRHDDASNLTLGERPRANHPGMKRSQTFVVNLEFRCGFTITSRQFLEEMRIPVDVTRPN